MRRCFFVGILVAAARGSGDELRLNAYTSSGELAQVTFASRGVEKSSPAVGFVLDDDNVGVLLHCSPRPSPLSVRVSGTIEWMDSVGVCAVGYKADCLRLKTEWRGIVENHKFVYGEAPAVRKIAAKLSSVLTSGLYPDRSDKEAPFARPLAASVLFLAREREAPRLRLVQLDNSGAIFRCHQIAALGSVATAAHSQDLAAISSDIVASSQSAHGGGDLAALVERVAASLFRHVRRVRDLEDDGELECECLIVDKRGRGHVLLANSPEKLGIAISAALLGE